jgi:hypothetical protein
MQPSEFRGADFGASAAFSTLDSGFPFQVAYTVGPQAKGLANQSMRNL